MILYKIYTLFKSLGSEKKSYINNFIQQGSIKFIKIGSKDIDIVTTDHKYRSFELSFTKDEKCITVSAKILSSTTVFNSDNNNKKYF